MFSTKHPVVTNIYLIQLVESLYHLMLWKWCSVKGVILILIEYKEEAGQGGAYNGQILQYGRTMQASSCLLKLIKVLINQLVQDYMTPSGCALMGILTRQSLRMQQYLLPISNTNLEEKQSSSEQ